MKTILSLVLFATGWLAIISPAGANLTPMDLRCDYAVNPLGVDSQPPRLFWKLEGGGRNQKQSAYEILAASSRKLLEHGEGDLWDSGRVKSDAEIDNFIAPVYQKVGVALIGFGLSYRNAGQKRVFATQRSSAYFGMCGCETELKNFLRAREYCEKALSIDKNDATSYNMLGTVFMELFNRDNKRDYLVKAKDSLEQALAINPAADFAKEAKQNLVQIREFLPLVK